ncbi:MAG: glycosyltransferase family 1 protein [Smithella sp.]|nr:glycosyltransferase family 1 protein [Smithella sp.]
MKIGIDLRAIGQGKYSGVEEYALNLLDALFIIDRKNKYLLFSSGQKISDRYLSFSRKAKENNPNIDLCHCALPNRILNTSFKLFSWPKIDNLMNSADVVFEPNINLLPTFKAKKIVTFHDLSFERYSNFFSAKQKFWHNFVNPKKLAREADIIIAVSESTKNDLTEIYDIPKEKIKVIYSGIRRESRITDYESRNEEIKIKYNLPDKYILYLGTIEPRKNIIGLIKAFELFKKSHLPFAISYKLVIAGSKGWLYENIFRAARNSSFRDDMIFTDFIRDEDKACLYNLSSLFVFPSFYEGFGFPPLEAMVQGVPVITSDCSSFPEVVGNAAIMVNPYNYGQLANAIGEILSDNSLRDKLIEKGRKQTEKFSWEKSARETLELFERVK